MRRWIHSHLTHHSWEEVTHRHDVESDGATIECYKLEEYPCGAVREQFVVTRELPSPFPGLNFGFAEFQVHELDRLEDAKAWTLR